MMILFIYFLRRRLCFEPLMICLFFLEKHTFWIKDFYFINLAFSLYRRHPPKLTLAARIRYIWNFLVQTKSFWNILTVIALWLFIFQNICRGSLCKLLNIANLSKRLHNRYMLNWLCFCLT